MIYSVLRVFDGSALAALRYCRATIASVRRSMIAKETAKGNIVTGNLSTNP